MDHICIYSSTTLLAKELIAFEPSHGFAIILGITGFRESWDSYPVTIHTSYPGISGHAVFHVMMRDIQRKKSLPAGSWEIIVLMFDVIEVRNEYPCLDWNICFDTRFDSPALMLERYLALETNTDLPFVHHDLREEDRVFLEETERLWKAGVDRYAEVYDRLRAIQDRVRHGPDRSYDAMASVLLEWKTRLRTFSSDTAAFLAFLETNLAFLESWCSQYLAEMSLEEKLRGWLTYGLRTTIPLPYFQEHWKLFFRLEGCEADTIVLDNTSYDISYRHSRALLARMEKEVRDAENAHLDLHPGIPCSREGGTFCLRCEEAKTLKAAEVYRSYRQRNNVFVNWELGGRFIDAWLLAMSRMTEEEKATIHYVWPPELVYHTGDIFFSWDGGCVCSRESFVDGLVSQRQYAYRSFEPREPEDVPRFLHLTLSPSYSLPDSLFVEGPNRWNEVHLFLLRFLSYAPTILPLDMEKCQALIAATDWDLKDLAAGHKGSAR